MLEASVLISLAAWRCTSLISYERGPFDIFLAFRTAIGFQHDSQGHPDAWPSTFFHQMIACPWCLGLWMALAMYGVWVWEPRAVMVLAAATILIVVQKIVHYGE